MNLSPIELSIVVVGNDCNPTILNPDFLLRTKIVQKRWRWAISGEPITTPAFATVSYDSDVTISVDPGKFQVIQRSLAQTLNPRRLVHIAKTYIKALPHVRYTAVGHNSKLFSENDDAGNFLKNRFLKEGVWNSNEPQPSDVGLKFRYVLDAYRLTISLDEARLTPPQGEQIGLLVQANYHRECTRYPAHEEVVQHLSHALDDWNDFIVVASKIVG
jgi:hypothetical protein